MNNKNLYVGLGVIGVLLIALFIYLGLKKPDEDDTATQPTKQEEQTTTNQQTPATSTQTKTIPAVKKLSYGEAIKAYKYRFQFVQCHANPGSMAVKKGSPIMLDNRDSQAHSIKTPDQTFTIAGFDYAVYYPNTIGIFKLTCDGGGSSDLRVEK